MIGFNKMTDMMETQEVIQKLIDNGYGEIVEVFLGNENDVYTKKGRLNKSAACRTLGWKGKQLEDALKKCREILKPDLGVDED